MNYLIKHNSYFMEFNHHFTTINSSMDFMKKLDGSSILDYKLFMLETRIFDTVFHSIEIYDGLSKTWNIGGRDIAFNLELIELFREFDEFEFRNNFDGFRFLSPLEIQKNITLMLGELSEMEEIDETLYNKFWDFKESISSILKNK